MNLREYVKQHDYAQKGMAMFVVDCEPIGIGACIEVIGLPIKSFNSVAISFPIENRREVPAQGDEKSQFWFFHEEQAMELVDAIMNALCQSRDYDNA